MTNTQGFADQTPDTVRVTIGDVAVSGLTFTSNAPQPLGATTVFTAAIATGSNVSYAWSFGDGATASGMNSSHTYIHPGTYTVTLIATNSLGSSTAMDSAVIQQTKWQIYVPAVRTSGANKTAPLVVKQAIQYLFR